MKKFFIFTLLILFSTSVAFAESSSIAAKDKMIESLQKQINELLIKLQKIEIERGELLKKEELKTKKQTPSSIQKPNGDFSVSPFSAEYFDSKKPKVVVKKLVVPEVTLNYAWDDIGIVSEDFAAKYTGTITAKADTTVLLTISQSWSETRVSIDGTVVYTGGGSTEKEIILKKGAHTVEVAYVNNWHTVGFRVGFEPVSTTVGLESVTNTLPKSVSEKPQILLASVYESGNDDNTLPLTVKKVGKASVLFLSSYTPVTWKLSGDLGDVKAIYVTSYEPGSKVIGANGIPVTKVKSQDSMIVYTLYPNCSDVGGMYHCESLNEFGETKSVLETSFKGSMYSASVDYGPSTLQIPGTVLSGTILKNIKNQVDAARKKQQEDRNDGVDSIF